MEGENHVRLLFAKAALQSAIFAAGLVAVSSVAMADGDQDTRM